MGKKLGVFSLLLGLFLLGDSLGVSQQSQEVAQQVTVDGESLTLPPAKAKRVSRTALRNELIDICEAFAHTLIAEVAQVSKLFGKTVALKKVSSASRCHASRCQTSRRCLIKIARERIAALGVVADFWGTPCACREKKLCPEDTSAEMLVRAQSAWMQALASVQEVLLTEVRLLLEQDAHGHFYGASKDELRKAKGSIESFMKDSVDCLACLTAEVP